MDTSAKMSLFWAHQEFINKNNFLFVVYISKYIIKHIYFYKLINIKKYILY